MGAWVVLSLGLSSGVAWGQAVDWDTLSAAHQALVADHERHPSEASEAALLEAASAADLSCEEEPVDAGNGVDPACVAAFRLREFVLGPDHPDVATGLNNLAVLLWSIGATAEAEPLYRRALEIREIGLGPDHPDVATSLNNLALLLQTTGAYAEAEPLARLGLVDVVSVGTSPPTAISEPTPNPRSPGRAPGAGS